MLKYSKQPAICKNTSSKRTAFTMPEHAGFVEGYSTSVDPRLILVLNEEAAVWSCFFLVQPILPDSVSPFQMYFIFDLTGAPCQCTVLINRVGSPERPSLSPILFQQSSGSVQSRREVLRLQVHSLEVSLCVWHSSNQQMQNTASIQGSLCA